MITISFHRLKTGARPADLDLNTGEVFFECNPVDVTDNEMPECPNVDSADMFDSSDSSQDNSYGDEEDFLLSSPSNSVKTGSDPSWHPTQSQSQSQASCSSQISDFLEDEPSFGKWLTTL